MITSISQVTEEKSNFYNYTIRSCYIVNIKMNIFHDIKKFFKHFSISI